MLSLEKPEALMSLCVLLYESQSMQVLIPHMMTFVSCKQSYSRFSEQLDFSGSEIIRIFRLIHCVTKCCDLIILFYL